MEQALFSPSIATLPTHARVWVYKSAMPFTAEQRALILERGGGFTASWATHGKPLAAVLDVLLDHFVVLSVDQEQAMASGCSIDKSVQFIRDLEIDLGLPLTDRMVVLYETEATIKTCRVQEVPDLLQRGVLDAGTTVFDDLVSTKGDLDTRFRVRLQDTWLSRYL